MDFKMREFEHRDIYTMSKILKKLDLKTDEINITEATTQEQVGIVLIQKVLESLHFAQEEVDAFLGDLVGLTSEEIGKLKIRDSIKLIELFKEQEDLKYFLKLAGQ